MRFRRSKKREAGPLIQGHGLQYFIRMFGFVGVIIACAVAFWFNFERRFEEINERTVFASLSDLMTSEEKKVLVAKARQLEESWGFDVKMEVEPEGVYASSIPSNTLYIAFAPKLGQAMVTVPPLVKRAIPEESLRFLTTELNTCAIESPPAQCLGKALDGIEALLSK